MRRGQRQGSRPAERGRVRWPSRSEAVGLGCGGRSTTKARCSTSSSNRGVARPAFEPAGVLQPLWNRLARRIRASLLRVMYSLLCPARFPVLCPRRTLLSVLRNIRYFRSRCEQSPGSNQTPCTFHAEQGTGAGDGFAGDFLHRHYIRRLQSVDLLERQASLTERLERGVDTVFGRKLSTTPATELDTSLVPNGRWDDGGTEAVSPVETGSPPASVVPA